MEQVLELKHINQILRDILHHKFNTNCHIIQLKLSKLQWNLLYHVLINHPSILIINNIMNKFAVQKLKTFQK